MKKSLFVLMVVLFVTSCGLGQTTFYWQQDGYGAEQFSRDHAYCMDDADWYPFGDFSIMGPKQLNLRPSFYDNRGIWAYYEPFKGAQPIYTNYAIGDGSVGTNGYASCMKDFGYTEKYAPYIRPEVGVLNCTTVNCDRDDYKDGYYRQSPPRR